MENENIITRQVKLAIQILISCIEKDIESKEKKQPPLEKIKILPYIEKILVKRKISEEFLKQGGLKYLQEYLKRNDDGTFSTLNQIDKILDLLDIIPLEKIHLDECLIHTNVIDLIKANLSESIKKKAIKLNNKFIRISTEFELNFSNKEAENNMYNKIFKRKRKNSIDANEEIKSKYDIINDNKRVPNKSLFDYTIMPESKVINLKDDELLNKKSYFNLKKESTNKKNKRINIVSELDN